MNVELLAALGVSLALTLIIETGFFLLTGGRDKKDLLLVVLVNVITNPAVVLLYWLAVLYTGFNLILVKIALELAAVFTEGHYYKKYARRFNRPYCFSAAANAVSYIIGALITPFI